LKKFEHWKKYTGNVKVYKIDEKRGKAMTRIEDNTRVCVEMMKRIERNKSFGSYEEKISFNLGVIATSLLDISKSLAILADKAESEDKE
jgi:hypothetical protein